MEAVTSPELALGSEVAIHEAKVRSVGSQDSDSWLHMIEAR
jgi:hypothetical protein